MSAEFMTDASIVGWARSSARTREPEEVADEPREPAGGADHPERFVVGPPKARRPPATVYINPPLEVPEPNDQCTNS